MKNASTQQKWTITSEQADMRLDHFLTQETERTRSSLQQLIKKGHVTVSGEKPTVHRFLRTGDVVVFIPPEEITASSRAKTIASKATHLPKLKDILVDTQPDYYVINKPAGLMVHPDNQGRGETLVDVLLTADPSLEKVGEDPSRPGIVHRLDRDVSGLMVVPRNQEAFEYFKRAFAQREVKKTYIALVHSSLPHDEDDIKFRIARSSTKARMAAHPVHEEEGKAAWTHYRVLARYRTATYAELEILSGRTHQIRAHMHALGCPVIGDQLYVIKSLSQKLKAPRLLLQSVGIEFTDPKTLERKHYTLERDPSFDIIMKDLPAAAV